MNIRDPYRTRYTDPYGARPAVAVGPLRPVCVTVRPTFPFVVVRPVTRRDR